MDEKYIVQFVTLLGGAFISIVMAYRVYTGQVDIVYALVVLLFALALFFILGRILRNVINKFHMEIVEKEKKEQEEKHKAATEEAQLENEEDSQDELSEETEIENEM